MKISETFLCAFFIAFSQLTITSEHSINLLLKIRMKSRCDDKIIAIRTELKILDLTHKNLTQQETIELDEWKLMQIRCDKDLVQHNIKLHRDLLKMYKSSVKAINDSIVAAQNPTPKIITEDNGTHSRKIAALEERRNKLREQLLQSMTIPNKELQKTQVTLTAMQIKAIIQQLKIAEAS